MPNASPCKKPSRNKSISKERRNPLIQVTRFICTTETPEIDSDLSSYLYYFFTEEEEEYIVKDRVIESSQTRKAAQQIQQNILQELHGMVGGARTLPKTVAHDMILQVFIINNTPTSYKSPSMTNSPTANINWQLFRVLDGFALVVKCRRPRRDIRRKVFHESM